MLVVTKTFNPVGQLQGLMLESASERLMQSGMPHHNCPDKVPLSLCLEVQTV